MQAGSQILLGQPRLLSAFSIVLTILTTLLSIPTASTSSSAGLLEAKGPPSPLRAEAAQLEILTANLATLRPRLNLTRRYFRLFRFLDSFATAQALYLAPAPTTTGDPGRWPDVTRCTLIGFYGLLESAAILDLSGVPVLGGEATARLNLEAQRFWFAALACGVLANLLRVASSLWRSRVPASSADGLATASTGDGAANAGKSKGEAGLEKTKKGEVPGDGPRQRAKGDLTSVVRKLVADVLDLTIPGSVLGWVGLDSGTVGWAMFVSTLLTGYDVWVRCGKQVAR